MWYRIVASGPVGNGPIKATAEEAWASWDRLARRSWCDGRDDLLGSAHSAMNATLIQATTRRAVMDADVSQSGGNVGTGWWYRAE